MLKHCPQHGSERVLISDDADYYRRCREVYLKPPEMPLRLVGGACGVAMVGSSFR
jgi:hypothetical protein